MAEIFSDQIVGKTLEEIDLYIFDFEVIHKDSVSLLKKASKGKPNNIKLIIDDKGKIESVNCFEK